ncbi:MAG TPA: hypothetical protein VJA26_02755 [Gammaproteobacteria bacterium]|nr:hypothetical protein [Gammaproteobacteria bacterium]
MMAHDLHVGVPVRLLVEVHKSATLVYPPGELGRIAHVVLADDIEFLVKLERGGVVIFNECELDQLELVEESLSDERSAA